MVTTALVFLFKSQPVMLDYVPQLGHVPRILRAMSSRNDAFPKHAIQILHQLSVSEVQSRRRASDSLHSSYGHFERPYCNEFVKILLI